MEFKSNLCPDVKHAPDKYGFIIATVGHAVLLLRSGLTLHIVLLVLFFFLMQVVVGRMMNSRRRK
jgi:hypothetical protein